MLEWRYVGAGYAGVGDSIRRSGDGFDTAIDGYHVDQVRRRLGEMSADLSIGAGGTWFRSR